MKKNNFRVEITEGDDVLDALSMRINQSLRTEKAIDDKKNNVYFWLFKFLILLCYLVWVNACFFAAKEVGVYLIYLFAVSLRSILAFVYKFGLTFVQFIFVTYILLKNLKIFTKSNYYKRLYAKDRYMLKKKRQFFGTIEKVLQAFGIVYLVFVGIIAVILVSFAVILIAMMFNNMFMLSLLAVVLILLLLCLFIFEELRAKFFGLKSWVRKEHLYVGLLALIFAVICFGYETNTYKINPGLPSNLETVHQSFDLTLPSINSLNVSSNAKFNNIEVKVDNSLDDVVRFDIESYETAYVSYVTHFNSDTRDMDIKFDGETNFKMENINDVFKLGEETIKNKTMYNYNMFKYPKITVYVSMSNYEKINLKKAIDSLTQ